MISPDDVLEALDLSRAEPGAGFLEALFARFNAKVPFENASKIVRDREIADPREKPRDPETFWRGHLALGTGGTCFARVVAFHWLLDAVGFRSRRLLGRVARDDDHAALIVETPAGERIVDVGFPLPVTLPARAGSYATEQGELELTETPRGFRVRYREGVPEGPRELEIFSAPVAAERFEAVWRDTFRPGSRFLLEVCVRRDLGHRVLSYAAGEIRVDDRHSRLRVPLPAARPEAALSELFALDAEVLARAFSAAGRPKTSGEAASLAAYLEAGVAPADAFSAIATLEGYRRLLGGIAETRGEALPGGFRVTLAPPGPGEGGSIEDVVTIDRSALRLSVERRGASGAPFASSYRAIARNGSTYLVREAALPGRGEELLRNDSLRGRLAGTLAVDLLAWTRMLRI